MSDLSRRAIRGLVRFQLFLAILLFGPAWSLRYPEAWLYWLLFSLSLLSITLYFLKHDPALVERRMAAGPRAEPRRRQQVIQAIASVLACALLVVASLDHRWGWSWVPFPAVLVGDALVILGMVVFFRVFRENSYTASTVRVEARQPVISTGPYACVRHPLYAGSFLLFLGTPLALGSLSALLPALLLAGVIVVRLLDEEQYLSQNLPGYEAYRKQVRHRLIPYVW